LRRPQSRERSELTKVSPDRFFGIGVREFEAERHIDWRDLWHTVQLAFDRGAPFRAFHPKDRNQAEQEEFFLGSSHLLESLCHGALKEPDREYGEQSFLNRDPANLDEISKSQSLTIGTAVGDLFEPSHDESIEFVLSETPSEGTTFDIGGAQIAIKAGASPGKARVTVLAASGTPVTNFEYSVKFERFAGAPLAVLPVFTVRLDPSAGLWDLFVFDRLLAEDLPLAPVAGARKFTLKAGGAGAWLCGLVLADENPLFVDANANGIDDTFETQKRGALLPATAPAVDRRQLALQWRQAQYAAPPTPWTLRRPSPDSATPR
jgi:hypothetical protein